MRIGAFSFGSIRIDEVTYEHDVVIDRRQVHKRKKKPSKQFRDTFGHTPLSMEEDIPWRCRRLVIGTGTGALRVMEEVKREAQRRQIKLIIRPTSEAIQELEENPAATNAILHVTCSATLTEVSAFLLFSLRRRGRVSCTGEPRHSRILRKLRINCRQHTKIKHQSPILANYAHVPAAAHSPTIATAEPLHLGYAALYVSAWNLPPVT